ncbi:hypothetical protein ABZ897_01080 [Nonomuraea sp. NPDC046802]|uniref:hypothetical protein n=1 Tax=Nonomuraea sp. NPDC046802 TaxID=3154919 RepID=UPI0033C6A44E
MTTTPAEAEREARVKQAQDSLALAAGVEHLSTYNYDTGRRSYKGGVEAMRDALVGQGHALLAVRDELADIAEALRTLAAVPSAIGHLTDHVEAGLAEVCGEIHELTATVEQGLEFADSTASATGSVAVALHELTDAVLRLSDPRPPRWWQFRLRRALRPADLVTESDTPKSVTLRSRALRVRPRGSQQDSP